MFSFTADALESLRQSCEFVCPNDGFLEQVCVVKVPLCAATIFLIENEDYDILYFFIALVENV